MSDKVLSQLLKLYRVSQKPGVAFFNEVGLRFNDAQLVVARHYDMFGERSKHYIDDVDIIVNGGSSQPGNDQTPYSQAWSLYNHHQAPAQEP